MMDDVVETMWEVPPKAQEGTKENGGTLHFAFPPFDKEYRKKGYGT
jgi:hypothetical protein